MSTLNKMKAQRTKDGYQKTIYEFIKDLAVVCPSCGGRAIVKTPDFGFGKKNEQEIKLICIKCGYNKRLEEKPDSILSASVHKIVKGKYLVTGTTIDPYFHLPLWFTVNCCDHILWAYNDAHINFLLTHVAAKLRERNTMEMSNKSLGSRLPKWMTSKKNRETILKALTHLKNKG